MLDAVEGYGEGARHFETQEELLAALKEEMVKGPHAVLFKASNFMKLFKLADELVRTWNKQEEKETEGKLNAARSVQGWPTRLL